MSSLAFFLILLSAICHASWNLIGKKTQMSVPLYGSLCFVAMITWIHVQFWTPIHVLELPAAFWYCVAGAVIFDGGFYCFGITLSYRAMEMSIAYPMMRSIPLLLTAAVTTIFGLGTRLTPLSILGMTIVFIGCMMMPLPSFSHFNPKQYLSKNMLFILMTACGTTGYTIFDSMAQKVLREALVEFQYPAHILSMTYYNTRSICLTSSLMLVIAIFPFFHKDFKIVWTKHPVATICAGLFGSAAYFLVITAMNFVSNVSFVQVFRQMGLVFGVAAGILILKEKPTKPKLLGVTLITLGLVLTVIDPKLLQNLLDFLSRRGA
ncbi:MAG: EamA family transporter [Victivallales bacterium]|nr:EamA family transporter [Victivallales bacterium]